MVPGFAAKAGGSMNTAAAQTGMMIYLNWDHHIADADPHPHRIFCFCFGCAFRECILAELTEMTK